MKDVSVPEIIVIAALCVIPVVMGLVLVVVAVCQKTGTSDVESWPSEEGEQQQLDGSAMKSHHEFEDDASQYDLEQPVAAQYDLESPSEAGFPHEQQQQHR